MLRINGWASYSELNLQVINFYSIYYPFVFFIFYFLQLMIDKCEFIFNIFESNYQILNNNFIINFKDINLLIRMKKEEISESS